MRRARLASLAVALGIGLTLTLAGIAFAFWAVTVLSGANTAEATSQTLPTGATPTVSVAPASSQSVTVTFAQASSSGGTALLAYSVLRYAVGAGAGTGTPVSGGCAVAASVVTCTDAPGPGSWTYTDSPTIAGSSWTGVESAKSATAIVQALPTVSALVASTSVVNAALTPSATLAGATTSPVAAGSITFSVFGPQATAPDSCTGTGWSTVGSGTGSGIGVSGNGTYAASAPFTPTSAGTYWWYASYGGDTYNAPAQSTCSATSTMVHLSLSPASLPAATVYTAYSTAVSASGGTAPYTFAVTSGALPSGLSLSSAGALSGLDSAAGQPGTYAFTVTATDHAGLTGSASYSLVVNPPAITLSSLANPTAETSDTQSVTASGGQAAYTYAKTLGTLPTGLSLSSAGTFSGSPSAPGTFTFTITATDGHGYTGSQAYSLTPVAPVFTFAPTSLPSAAVYTAYSQALTITGGAGGYSYGETGTLPSGFTLSSAGVLSGTDSAASQPGSYPITVTATDADGFSGTKSYTLVVNGPLITLAALTNPTGETTYSQSATASGGQGAYTYAKTSGTLPTGLSLNTSTGGITGTSTHSGTFTFTITATDSHGYTGSQGYTLTPVAPAFTFAPTSLPAATAYTAYSQTITTTGGVSTYTYGETGTLPSGITLSSAGGLSGTDSAAGQPGSYPITVTATDADGFTGSTAYTLVVNPPTITITPATLPSVILGIGYSHPLTAAATGFSGDTFTYAKTGGSFPSGMSMSSSGVVTASTGLALGTYTFTVTATDANGYTGSQLISVTCIL